MAYSLHLSDTIFVVDAKDRITTIFVGQPNDPEWTEVSDDATKVLDAVREAGLASNAFLDKYLAHRRGDFVAIPVGVSFGGGQKVCMHYLLVFMTLVSNLVREQLPGNLVHSQPRQRLINKLLSHKSIKRIAGFQSSKF